MWIFTGYYIKIQEKKKKKIKKKMEMGHKTSFWKYHISENLIYKIQT